MSKSFLVTVEATLKLEIPDDLNLQDVLDSMDTYFDPDDPRVEVDVAQISFDLDEDPLDHNDSTVN